MGINRNRIYRVNPDKYQTFKQTVMLALLDETFIKNMISGQVTIFLVNTQNRRALVRQGNNERISGRLQGRRKLTMQVTDRRVYIYLHNKSAVSRPHLESPFLTLYRQAQQFWALVFLKKIQDLRLLAIIPAR
jgi:hypothetical protein